jgi:hypothetical protein
MSAPIFISYSSKDQTIAETICNALEARGHACWISCRDVHPGQNFQEAIVQALRAARVMLLVFTANANNSDEIKKEVVLAGRHRVTVVPIRVEDVVPNDAFAYEFATRQWIDLFKDWEREIERLVAQIGTVLQTAIAADSPAQAVAAVAAVAPARPAPRRKSGQNLGLIAAGVAAVAVAGGVVYALRPAARTPPSEPTPIAARTGPNGPTVAPGTPEQALPTRLPNAAPPPRAPQVQTAGLEPPPAPAATGGAPPAAGPPAAAVPPVAVAVAVPPPVPATTPPPATTVARTNAFDGTWLTTLNCPTAGTVQAFSYQFAGEVKDGAYRGQRGIEGKPGWYTLEGKIKPDGTALLIANGLVGAAAFAVNHVASGTSFTYGVSAKFEGETGAGKRMDGLRECNVTFAKQ